MGIKLNLTVRFCLPFFSALLIPFICQAADIEGPRALGLGGAYTAIADGPDSVRTNPAGIAAKRIYSATLSRHRTDSDTNAVNATIIDYKTTNAPVGISYTKEELPKNQRKYGIFSVAASAPASLIGISAKYFWDELSDKEDYSYDAGILLFPYKGLTIGAAGKNLEKTDLPHIHKSYSAGIAYSFNHSITAALDYTKDEDAMEDDGITAFGLEYFLKKDVIIRGGFTKNEIRDIDYYSAGITLFSPKLSLEYGYRWDKEDSDSNVQAFSAIFYF
ncbi:MAG: hypothetical protein OEV42_13705 [Deltaproteobacteria bacterium]|nr:hypothetical protein [Deltaproteobacteria bacterium]